MEDELLIQFPEKFDYALTYQERELPLEDDESKLSLQQRLLIYALRQQAKVGKCNEPSPAFWHAKERAMWSAWSEINHMSNFEAMVYFARILDEEKPGWLKEELKYRNSQTSAPTSPDSDDKAGPPTSPTTDNEKDLSDKIIRKDSIKSSTDVTSGGVHVEVIPIPTPPGSERGDDCSLEKQLATLKFRLSNSLRDVNERDVTIAALRAENAQLKELLMQSSSVTTTTTNYNNDINISSNCTVPPSVSSMATNRPDPSSPVQAGYYRTHNGDRRQTWFSWLVGM